MAFRQLSPSLLLLVAGCSAASPDPADFERWIPAAAELDERMLADVRASAERAVLELANRNFSAARAAADQALETDPRNARALAVRARTRQRQAAADDPPSLRAIHTAEGELRLATKVAPNDPVVAALHAVFLERVGHLAAAAKRAEQGLEATPRDLELLRVASRIRYDIGDERRASDLLIRLFEANPDEDPELRFRLAECRMAIARSTLESADKRAVLERAVLDFERYRAARPEDSNGFVGEAHARAAILDLDSSGPEDAAANQVLQLLLSASKLDLATPLPDYDRGVFLEKLGRPKDARGAYEAALRRAPDHVASLLNLAANQASAGMEDEARATCERALDQRLTRDERSRIERYLGR